jgi:DNA polymerase-3 subunit delta
MLAERRVVAVRDVGGLKKDARSALDRYLARPASDTVLVLLVPAGAKPTRRSSSARPAVDFEPLQGQKLAAWLEGFARRELGVDSGPASGTCS